MNTLLSLLEFMYTDVAHFFGTIFVIFVIGSIFINIAKSIRLFEINKIYSQQEATRNTNVDPSVFSELLSLWNKRKDGGKQ